MDKLKTTQLSGLTDYELELELIVTQIKFADTTLEGIKILESYIDSISNEEIRESDESDCPACTNYRGLPGYRCCPFCSKEL